MKHYDLNNLKLFVNSKGFTLVLPETNVKVDGEYDTPDTVICRYHRSDVLDSYKDQVLSIERRGVIDAESDNEVVIEAIIALKPNENWFELDHTTFNEAYISGSNND